jgi:hypothetical protein
VPKTTERVQFRLIHMECCHVLLRWVNSRLPNYCPECGNRAYPAVLSWIRFTDETAFLKRERIP